MLHSFLLGTFSYPLIELVYRRRTHWTMALAGGLSVLSIDLIRKRHTSLLRKAFLGGAVITAIELCVGLIWNRNHSIWDYRNKPLNFLGQICLPFSLLWCAMSALAITLLNRIHPRAAKL